MLSIKDFQEGDLFRIKHGEMACGVESQNGRTLVVVGLDSENIYGKYLSVRTESDNMYEPTMSNGRSPYYFNEYRKLEKL